MDIEVDIGSIRIELQLLSHWNRSLGLCYALTPFYTLLTIVTLACSSLKAVPVSRSKLESC